MDKPSFGSSSPVDTRQLRRWCAIPASKLPDHPQLRVCYRQVEDLAELGALTAGEKGAYGFECGRWQYCPAPAVEAVSTTGAGDALLAGVVCGLAAGLPFIHPGETPEAFSGRSLQTVLDIGVLIASFSVTSPHTIHPRATLQNLFAFAESHRAVIADDLRSVCTEQGEVSAS